MDARRLRRAAKNGLHRLPAPIRGPVGRMLLRCYEWYVAARTSGEGPVFDNGLAVPPPKLRVRVVGHTNVEQFLTAGQIESEIIRQALARNGAEIEQLESMLDWGCGCGRILRWWKELPQTRIHGSDYDPQLVGWVEQNLPFVSAKVNQLSPPLPFESESFDLVYAISIFTHLDDRLAAEWMREIHRVLAPGGRFFFTTHGESYRDRLSTVEDAAFESGRSVVQFGSTEGSNLCAAFHPPAWIRSRLLDGFELEELRQAHELDPFERSVLAQDRWLIRKTP